MTSEDDHESLVVQATKGESRRYLKACSWQLCKWNWGESKGTGQYVGQFGRHANHSSKTQIWYVKACNITSCSSQFVS
jgi:hypothetical protein